MVKRLCFVSVDVEFELKNSNKILEIFRKYNIPATLFVTGEILERHPNFFGELPGDYEIACHSFTHRFWDGLGGKERKKELEDFISLHQRVFNGKPKGFRAPSHLIDKAGLKLLEEKGFSYDSSIVPHYPPFKKYRGYRGRKPLLPYHPEGLKILEIPVRGQIFGIPLAGAWISRLPFWFYYFLFAIYRPTFITLSWHSWNSLRNLDKTLNLLKKKKYQFFNGEQVFENYK